eukprot:1138721-Pelagomonas_calceolata.AAC.4
MIPPCAIRHRHSTLSVSFLCSSTSASHQHHISTTPAPHHAPQHTPHHAPQHTPHHTHHAPHHTPHHTHHAPHHTPHQHHITHHIMHHSTHHITHHSTHHIMHHICTISAPHQHRSSTTSHTTPTPHHAPLQHHISTISAPHQHRSSTTSHTTPTPHHAPLQHHISTTSAPHQHRTSTTSHTTSPPHHAPHHAPHQHRTSTTSRTTPAPHHAPHQHHITHHISTTPAPHHAPHQQYHTCTQTLPGSMQQATCSQIYGPHAAMCMSHVQYTYDPHAFVCLDRGTLHFPSLFSLSCYSGLGSLSLPPLSPPPETPKASACPHAHHMRTLSSGFARHCSLQLTASTEALITPFTFQTPHTQMPPLSSGLTPTCRGTGLLGPLPTELTPELPHIP